MNLKFRIARNVIIAVLIVAAINFLVLYFLNFPQMALLQIKKYWFLLALLISGFGVQIGLYTYIKHKALVCSVSTMASGGVSGISMLLCCSHYLVNFLPFISLAFANVLLKYTPYILLFGIISNAFGIIFMTLKSQKLKISDDSQNSKKILKLKITRGKKYG
ncbi:MAG: hypothetical protein AABW67_05660 [Nanoarchaeota archaeon]